MSGFCICLFKMNGNGVFFFLVACLFVKMLTVLVYRDDTHNIIDCLNKFVLVTVQNTYRNKHTVLQPHFNRFNVCNNEFIQNENSAESQVSTFIDRLHEQFGSLPSAGEYMSAWISSSGGRDVLKQQGSEVKRGGKLCNLCASVSVAHLWVGTAGGEATSGRRSRR